jgi:hypothetical protein
MILVVVDGSGDGYLKTACDYVHLNPCRARLLKPEDRLLAYPWSSLVWYAAAREHRPGWMRVDRLLGEHGIPQDTAAARRAFEERMEARRRERVEDEALQPLRQGWCLGGPEFRQQMLARMEGKLGEFHAGELRRESAQARAERIIGEELRRLGWAERDLAVRRKSDPDKLAIAARLRRDFILRATILFEFGDFPIQIIQTML